MSDKIRLPLISEPAWEGLTPVGLLAADGPEPLAPQGAYGPGEAEISFTAPAERPDRPVELLAPAGGLDAGFAAFHFGADAIYLGLKKFSARAEAENFTLDELDEITAYAHALQPRRRVFVTINTLIRQDELAELIDTLASLVDLGVDAVIVQDLGVYRAVRQFFPQLELHGSTQMAVHNRAGAETLKDLGFSRVVLARELTFEEVNDITAAAGVETEVFIHGALCYAYSGLCLFSSQTLGRSGNRGKCAYSCRDSYDVADAPMTLRDGSAVKRDPRRGFPFSMKDLALPDHLPALRATGVSCFKIEGRKKSPLYVATTTDYYRKLLDGTLKPDERPLVEADLQTVFSRPWTRLFVQSHKDKEVADRDTVGHRGALIGKVQAVLSTPSGSRLRFRAARPLQRHDGLQIDLPILGKPFGFAVDHLWLADSNQRNVIETPTLALVEVALPMDAPQIPVGAPVYCSSSQAVKQRYRHARPKPALWHDRKPLHIEATLTGDRLRVTATADGVSVEREVAGPFAPANDLPAMENAVRGCFARLGQSRFQLASLTWSNAANGFVPLSQLNQLRRDVVAELDEKIKVKRAREVATVQTRVSEPEALAKSKVMPTFAYASGSDGFAWSIKVDRVEFLDALANDDYQGVDEVVVDIARDHPAALREKLDALAEHLGRERIRLALPALTRAWEEKGLVHKIRQFQADGWRKWEAANLSAWHYLGVNPQEPGAGIDLATDWSVYVINRLAAQQVLDMGATRFALSPEDGFANARSLWTEFGARAVLIVYQDTPQFLAESCAYANLIGGCPGKANCRFESMEMISSHGERVTALDYHCRTIVLNQEPFCLSSRLGALKRMGAISLRADFTYRPYDPQVVRERWRQIRAGRTIRGTQDANFERGIL
ncbi:MAG: U32 family peptidase [Planctomycetes bacterium]|nr:U32 family peptidase [Planctomycetota bacterium]